MNTTVLGPDLCPYCGEVCDRQSGDDDAAVHPGAITICFYCAGISVLDDDLKLAKAGDDLIESLPDDVRRRISRLVDGIKALIAERALEATDDRVHI